VTSAAKAETPRDPRWPAVVIALDDSDPHESGAARLEHVGRIFGLKWESDARVDVAAGKERVIGFAGDVWRGARLRREMI
jgi:hypothetical protein